MVILRIQAIVGEQNEVGAPFRAESPKVEKRHPCSQVESNVSQTGSVDQDEGPNDRRPVGVFFGLYQEALLAISLLVGIVEYVKIAQSPSAA